MKERDIGSFIKAGLGIELKDSVILHETDFTYPIKDVAWDNWFPFAYIAFRRLAEEENVVRSFATIGTGNGADAIGAFHAFKDLQKIVITDIDKKVVSISEENVKRNTKGINLIALQGSLCKPLKSRGIRVDLIYENLPNIPDADNIIEGYRRSSRFEAGSISVGNEKMKKYLLESHFASLIEAKESLNSRGSVICSIGGRVPYDLLHGMIQSAGYSSEELLAGFKVQTEPEEVFPGYAKAERGGVDFDFFRYNEAVESLKNNEMEEPFIELRGDELKNLLGPYRISAKESLELYDKDPSYKIGHTVHMIRAIKKD